jgi:hypothetical protein
MSQYDFIDQGGHKRIFSLKPRTMPVGDPRCCTSALGVDAGPPIIPREKWPEEGIDLSHAVEEILDQNGYSLCHSFGGTQVNQIAHHLAGHPGLRLSAGNLAGQVTGYQDEGAGVDEVLAVLIADGQTTRALIGEDDYRGRDWPSDWKTDAAKHRVLKSYDCGHDDVFDAVVSCIIYGWPVEIGTNAFGGGHAVTVTRFYKKGGVWRLRGPNSWGEDWTNCDQAGYWDYSESQISRGLDSFGAFGLEASVANPDDVVPVVK